MPTDLEKCAAYVATRGALAELRGTTAAWPPELAEHAHASALAAVTYAGASLDHAEASAGRRRCIRTALEAALALSAACDVASALGHATEGVRYEAGRAAAMLGLYFHASSHSWPEDEM